MQNEPTTLINPRVSVDPSGTVSGMPIGLGIFGAILIVCALVMVTRRRARRMDPRELAFRTITRKLGYSRGQIRVLRQTAMKSGLTSPVGLVMSPSMSTQIFASSKRVK